MSRFVLYTAVLPPYRNACLDVVGERLGAQWTAYAGDEHLDRTVRSAAPEGRFHPVRNRALLGRRLLLQTGSWSSTLAADVAILDLNPRSLSAWCLLAARRLRRRRTLVWGHLQPRGGPACRTAALRRRMRRFADGCIVYSWVDAATVRREYPDEPVWVAPNALYRREDIGWDGGQQRREILYVGRLEEGKKPQLLLEAFAHHAPSHPDTRLVFIGDGTAKDDLAKRAAELGLACAVEFLGRVHDAGQLRRRYGGAVCSVSPGYAGLSLTQSLCFGVPMVVAHGEPHSPEIELAVGGGVTFFPHDSATALAAALGSPDLLLTDVERDRIVSTMRERYSAEAMADGVCAALAAEPGACHA